jgi:hypothetical protein
MLKARHFFIFTDHKTITYTFHQTRDKCSPRQFNHLDFDAHFTRDIRHISGKTVLSPTSSLASCPSLRYNPTTHQPHCRTATTSSEDSWSQPLPCSSRK